MAALSAPRNTVRRDARHREPVADAKCWQGGVVVSDAGDIKPGATDTGLVVLGIALNTAEIGDRVRIERGCFRLDNSASTDEITAADIGTTAYLVDDHTVAKTDGSSARSPAGKIFDVDELGVWVELG